MSPLQITVLALAIIVVVAVAWWAVTLARRIDRLHQTLIAARHALDTHLVRRAVAAHTLAVSGQLGPAEAVLLADAASECLDHAGPVVGDGLEKEPLKYPATASERALAESRLTAVLTQLSDVIPDGPQWNELTSVWYHAGLARTFHDGRVERVRKLRRNWFVRLLRLTGHAPYPEMFDADLSQPPGMRVHLRADAGRTALPERTAGRVLPFRADGAVLLLRGHDPDLPEAPFWFTVGGGVEPGETLRETAARELWEEAGIRVAADALIGPVATRRAPFEFVAGTVIGKEEFYLAYLPVDTGIDMSGWTESEHELLDDIAWMTPDELRQRQERGEAVHPRGLVELLDRLYPHWDGQRTHFTE